VTGNPAAGWKVAFYTEDSENVPLWKALAQFTSEDLDEGLKANAAVIKREKLVFQRYYNLAFVTSLLFGFLFLVFLLGLLISIHSKSANALLLFVLAFMVATVAPHLWRQAYQYGLTTPDVPLALPHAADRHFDEFLGHLQKASGPKAYYLSRFGKKRKPLNRRQFFGRLRYFLFSEHSRDRGMVMRFPTAMSIPADLYVHRDDVEKMIAMSKPKRKAGPGRNPKYGYADAIISLIGNPRLDSLDLSDQAKSVRTIKDWLSGWFEAAADASGDVPRGDQLTPHAEKIFERLKIIAP
jgi:hypothetical protein